MMEQMTLDELKTGMHVIDRNGHEYLVLKNTCLGDRDNDNYVKDVIVEIPKSGCFISLTIYDKNMINVNGFKSLDIVAIYNCDSVAHVLDSVNDEPQAFTQIYAEEEPITRAEAEKLLGRKIVD